MKSLHNYCEYRMDVLCHYDVDSLWIGWAPLLCGPSLRILRIQIRSCLSNSYTELFVPPMGKSILSLMAESQQYCSVVRFEWCCKVLFVVLPKYNRFWTVFLNMHLISVQKVSFKLCGGWRESIEWQRLYRFFPHWENKDPLQTLSVRKNLQD